MKKFYMTMAAMLCGVAAMAQNELYGEPIKAEKGETVNLTISLRNADPVTAISFKLELPAGVKAAGKNKWILEEDRIDTEKVTNAQAFAEEVDPADVDLDITSVYTFFLQKGVYALAPVPVKYPIEGGYEFVTFTGNEGPIMSVPLTIADTVEDGVYEVKILDPGISSATDPVQNIVSSSTEPVIVTLTVGEGTGINSINADDVNAPIYNVAGQRVSKAQKGVFIQNGKKIAVK